MGAGSHPSESSGALARIEGKLDGVAQQLADGRVQFENHRMRLGELERFRDQIGDRIEEATERAVRKGLSAERETERGARGDRDGGAGGGSAGGTSGVVPIRVPVGSIVRILRKAGAAIAAGLLASVSTWWATRSPAPAVPPTSPAAPVSAAHPGTPP